MYWRNAHNSQIYDVVVTFGDSFSDIGHGYGISNQTWSPLPSFNSNEASSLEPITYTISSSVTYPTFWRSPTSLTAATSSLGKRCGCGCGGCASLKEMIHLQWQMIASPVERCRISRGRCGISLREM